MKFNSNDFAEMKVDSICIIDDDKIYRFTTEKYLQMLRLTSKVMTYADGEEAISYLRDNSQDPSKLPDIIFLDLNMPIMDGWDFIEEYIKLRPNLAKKIVVYMVSSSIDERDQARALEISEVSDFIIKPITEEQLITLVGKAVA